MPPADPAFAELMRAITVYMPLAHPGKTPAAVQRLLDALRDSSDAVMKCSAWTPEPSVDPVRYTLRLGNQFYPHMKLVLEPAPDGSRFLYRADTHDRHICPATTSPEHAAFCELMEKNQRLAEAIDTAWEQAAVPTFKSYLRDDLRRRQAAMPREG